MLNPFIWLLLLSITMLIGSFIFGCIPLSAKLSETKLRQLTAIGVGLLIGTSLVVIIPEGVETLYSIPVVDPGHGVISTPTMTTGALLPWQTSTPSLSPIATSTSFLLSSSSSSSPPPPPPVSSLPTSIPTFNKPHHSVTKDDHDDDDDNTPKHVSVGLALILGFGVMFVIDQFSSLHAHSGTIRSDREHELDSMLTEQEQEQEQDEEQEHDEEGKNKHDNKGNTIHHAHNMTPTIGLMVHAAADGIALGASASHPQLSMVVFFAIMLHKGPSAFALTTVLLAEGMSRVQVRKHLLLFSMAAPTGALVTYILLSITSPGDVSLEYWTGVLLLFSGGTFLYVAMHALQELQAAEHHLDRVHVLCILFGMFLPVFFNLGHSH